jgi:alpha-beta hydrolase superfamily lysophospholipase
LAEALTNYTLETFTASDGYRWRYRRYCDKKRSFSPRAHVVCLHGIQSHGGWYEYSCSRLSEAGFQVSFLDRRGSGLNDEARGDASSFGRLLDDVAEFLAYLRPTREPSRQATPVFLAAISWGAKLAAALPRRGPGQVDGLALLCPGFFPKVHPSWRQRLRIGWSRLVAPQRLFSIPLNDPALFTASPHWQQFLRQDPLSLRQATARLLIESVRLDHYLRSVPARVQVPVLLFLAERDRIIDNAATRRFVEEFATRDKEVIEYAGAHHTLEFEPDRDRFINDLVRWLNRHSGPQVV